MTSAPHEPIFSVHIRVLGDWTKELASRLGIVDVKGVFVQPATLPYIMIDGPYGAPAEDALNYETGIILLFTIFVERIKLY